MATTVWSNIVATTNLDIVTSLAAHDVALAFALSDNTAATFTWPSGFTELGTQVNTFDSQVIGVAIKKDCTGSEGTLRITSSSGSIIGLITGTSGMDNTTQPNVSTPTPSNNNSGSTSPWTITGAITPVTNGAMIFAFMGSDENGAAAVTHTFSDTGGLSWTAVDINQAANFRHGAVGYATQSTAAATTVTGTGTAASGSAGRSMILVALTPAAGAGPNITSVSTATPREGASLTITGTAFGASQGSGDVKINGVAQTVTSWSDTSIAVTIVLGTNKFGAAYTVVVRDNALTASNSYAGITGLLPANSGLSYVDIGTPNTTSAYRLTSTADLVSGDQVEYENKGSGVTVATDGTFTAAAGIASFSARAWTTGSGYGAAGVQLLINTGSLLMSNSHKNKRRRF